MPSWPVLPALSCSSSPSRRPFTCYSSNSLGGPSLLLPLLSPRHPFGAPTRCPASFGSSSLPPASCATTAPRTSLAFSLARHPSSSCRPRRRGKASSAAQSRPFCGRGLPPTSSPTLTTWSAPRTPLTPTQRTVALVTPSLSSPPTLHPPSLLKPSAYCTSTPSCPSCPPSSPRPGASTPFSCTPSSLVSLPPSSRRSAAFSHLASSAP
mmetsp:Transcript_13630/g.42867  ORF Transcript_13630/g.42867 Transcript_13630/m.42867 type:complete len:209 (-) Transcript_13630:298-924(-)